MQFQIRSGDIELQVLDHHRDRCTRHRCTHTWWRTFVGSRLCGGERDVHEKTPGSQSIGLRVMLAEVEGSIAEVGSSVVRNFTWNSRSDQNAVAMIQRKPGAVRF